MSLPNIFFSSFSLLLPHYFLLRYFIALTVGCLLYIAIETQKNLWASAKHKHDPFFVCFSSLPLFKSQCLPCKAQQLESVPFKISVLLVVFVIVRGSCSESPDCYCADYHVSSGLKGRVFGFQLQSTCRHLQRNITEYRCDTALMAK